MIDESQTLSERLCAGPISTPDALRIAMELADLLRSIHSEGRCYGALTPDSVQLAATGLDLLPAPAHADEALTPYAAPEQFLGHSPDACTDIFSFGALLYEMLTGVSPFEGETRQALAESIAHKVPAPISEARLDRLVSTCLAKERTGRWQRMQQVVMELKLLSASARRTETGAVPRFSRIESSLRFEIGQLEANLASRLERHEKAVAEMLRAADTEFSRRQAASVEAISEALTAVRSQFVDIDRDFAEAQKRGESAAEEARNEVATLHAVVADEIQALKNVATENALAIESARSATARTDDLVERVVEALESLQNLVLDQSEDRAMAVAR